MRLIDADKFKEQIAAMAIKNGFSKEKKNKMFDLIDRQLTSYDLNALFNRIKYGIECAEVLIELNNEYEECNLKNRNGLIFSEMKRCYEEFFEIAKSSWKTIEEVKPEIISIKEFFEDFYQLTKKRGSEMTENEAIDIIDNYKFDCEKFGTLKMIAALGVATKSLEEIQQYRVIGTVEECREAMERQKQKVPDIWGDGCDERGNLIYDMYDCPNCGKSYEVDHHDYKYCPECGQAIDRMDLDKFV